jgi:hypothetical protein
MERGENGNGEIGSEAITAIQPQPADLALAAEDGTLNTWRT